MSKPENTHKEYTLRRVHASDYPATERLAWQAFEDRSRLPGGRDEHYLLHCLRQSADYIPELDYVAEDKNGQLLGQIIWSHAAVVAPDGTRHPVLTFGPLGVLPAAQCKGIGGTLVRHTIALAAQAGHTRVVIMGHPAYYPRFGFLPGEGYGITPANGVSHEACMALALCPGAFDGVRGRFMESPAFTPDPAGLAQFNRDFG